MCCFFFLNCLFLGRFFGIHPCFSGGGPSFCAEWYPIDTEYTLISLPRCLLMDICVISSFWLFTQGHCEHFVQVVLLTFSLLPGKSLRGGVSWLRKQMCLGHEVGLFKKQ